MKLKAIIIDDEPGSIESLSWELQFLKDDVEIIATASSPQAGIQAIRSYNPDVVFLDIEMPGLTGFDLLKKLDTINFEVVFTTAYDEFAIQAFKVNAIDYLLKPIDETELAAAVAKVQQRKNSAEVPRRLEELLKVVQHQNQALPTIALPTLTGLEFIEVAQISHCTSESNYTKIHSLNGNVYLISKTLKEVEKSLLQFPFLRVHHSHLVHLVHIRRYVKGKGGFLILKNNISIPVARSKKEDLMRVLAYAS